MSSSRSDRAAKLHEDQLVWDQHTCLPLRPDSSLIDSLSLHAESGANFVSVNVGFDVVPALETIKVLSAFRQGVLERPDRFVLVRTIADVDDAKRLGKLAVSFDLEGAEPLDGCLAMVQSYYDLGVRTMLMAYNQDNRAAGGCHAADDIGLTEFGKAVLREMNRLGMLVDATHCSKRTTLDLFEMSAAPVVFSHSVPARVKVHPRNIDDEQLEACAATGGVVGINGVGIFLGENDNRTEAVVHAIDCAVDVIGPEHVGLGLDYVFDQDELNSFLRDNRDTFPAGFGYREFFPHKFVSPTQLPEITEALLDRGYRDAEVRGIVGGNFHRVASGVWR
jgi:membrane dipeptidase